MTGIWEYWLIYPENLKLAENWYDSLKNNYSKLNLQGIRLIAYPDVGSNNAELPEKMYIITDKLPLTADKLNNTGVETELNKIFEDIQLFLAPTEYSTTAPLKNASRKYGFRAATMPGFSIKMVPALRIDYNEVNQRVLLIKEKLDKAQYAEVEFLIDNKDEYKIFLTFVLVPRTPAAGDFLKKE